jgi:predicted amidophosphoribosyltransferase
LPLFCLECGRDAPCGVHKGALVRAGAVYSGAARGLVHIMKYENARSVAKMAGEMLATRFGRPMADFLVPVPLHKSSERDYNQAESLAHGAGSVWHLDMANVLKWRIALPRQALKPGSERSPLPEDAMVSIGALDGAKVFLIDDVYTSGSTMRAAARALEGSGATVTGAMVWCRAVSKGHGRPAF